MENILDKKTESRIELLKLYRGLNIRIEQDLFTIRKIRIEQMNLRVGFILTKKQLIEQVKNVFSLEIGVDTICIEPILYKPKLISLDSDWLLSKMNKYKLKIKELLEVLPIKKKQIISFIQKKETPNYVKEILFYYFYSLDKQQVSTNIFK